VVYHNPYPNSAWMRLLTKIWTANKQRTANISRTFKLPSQINCYMPTYVAELQFATRQLVTWDILVVPSTVLRREAGIPGKRE
jgi:hypothetical protein